MVFCNYRNSKLKLMIFILVIGLAEKLNYNVYLIIKILYAAENRKTLQ